MATLLVEGTGAAQLVRRTFAPTGRQSPDDPSEGRLADVPEGRLALWRLSPGPGEQVVVRYRCDHSIELHCHGGLAAAGAIVGALKEQGCRAVSWQQWIDYHHNDPIAAAAAAALTEARTQRTSAVLLDQYNGALRRAIDEIEALLSNGEHRPATTLIDALLDRAKLGQHLTQPWRVVLAGPPNAGKSSLVNALLGYQRAIVHHVPGTTRDVVTTIAAMDGWPVELSDTAGLRDTGRTTESAGVELARRKLAHADLVLLVFDASRPWTAADDTLVGSTPRGLVVNNKIDLPPAPGPRPAGLDTSVVTGAGIEALVGAIVAGLVPSPPAAGAAVPFTREQIDLIKGLR